MEHKEGLQGQIVALILLVILVGATLGFSIAGTTIRNIQETSNNEESNRAYSAAEAGIETKLLEIETAGSAVPITTPTGISSGAEIKQVTVNSSTGLAIALLPKDQVAQLNLVGAAANTSVAIQYDDQASIVVSKISGTDPNYNVSRWAFNCNNSRSNGFSNASIAGATYVYDGVTKKCTLTISGINGSVGVDQVMRIRAMYEDTSLTVTTPVGSLPVQSTVVTSTGRSGESERTIRVERSQPVAPAIFDYVLFSSQGSLSK